MRARKAPGNARHEIFVISAHMEWRYDKNDKPARNVFELGLKKHILVPEYVKLYAEFLVGINDVANARVLFERAVAVAADAASGKIDSDSKNIIPGTNRTTGVLSMGPQERERRTNVLRDVFDLFVSFEHHHGSSGTMSSVEQRRHVALGGHGGGAIDAAPAILTALIARHSFLDLAPCTFEQQAHYVKLGATMPRRNTSVDTKNTNVPPPRRDRRRYGKAKCLPARRARRRLRRQQLRLWLSSQRHQRLVETFPKSCLRRRRPAPRRRPRRLWCLPSPPSSVSSSVCSPPRVPSVAKHFRTSSTQ